MKIVALAGNPNVGKSTIFNKLTGKREHTGNWSGKTVEIASSKIKKRKDIMMIDLPGTYSLCASSNEERVCADFIESGKFDKIAIVCDAICLERNLILALQIMQKTSKVMIIVNMLDEAKSRNITIDFEKLHKRLNVPIVGVCAKDKGMYQKIIDKIDDEYTGIDYIEDVAYMAADIARDCVLKQDFKLRYRKIDKILTGKWTAVPIMLILLAIIFWITITGSNYPSAWLSKFLFSFELPIENFLIGINVPTYIVSMISQGAYRVFAWVVAVMLPPMAIFFPLFSFFEDLGYLPRVAFNLDKTFAKVGSCGSQSLTTCMGFGCNAAAIASCRIISSPKARLIAMLTNNFVPCNGRFPTLIAIISMFFIGESKFSSIYGAIILTSLVLVGILMTFIVSFILSKTMLKGEKNIFTIELPPYRKPQIIQILKTSFFEKTLKVLYRAIIISVPAGIIIWLMANTMVFDISILNHLINLLDNFAKIIGLDGVILVAFILGFPANEIVMPIMVMGYLGAGSLIEFDNLYMLKDLLINNGWTIKTAVCMMIFTIMHWPCSTTCLTIKKESGSMKWAVLGFVIPTIAGVSVCFLINVLYNISLLI